ncbi:phospholipid phosphatase-related protein type 2-like, partial [Haemorhous mexicanus]|uniref:phospholipid phosphatase-related protein type 2-like n=1 Tax=Haemorhous mexicanus TaxID=30427 RepID=UPI0028BD77FF
WRWGSSWAAWGGPVGVAPPPSAGLRAASGGAPLRRLLRFLGVFSFGLLATAIFANAGQVVLGTPAPHFLAVCRPNYSALGCAPLPRDPRDPRRDPRDPRDPLPSSCPRGAPPAPGTPPAVAAARRDFPCKEAALGAYAGAFAGLAKPAAVLGFAAPPFLLGALRVAEHRNSWGGVLGGFLCGTAIAAFLVTCVVGNFQNAGGDSGWAGTPRAPPELPPQNAQPPLEEISVSQVRRAEFPAVT